MDFVTVSNILIAIAVLILFFELGASPVKLKRQTFSLLLACGLEALLIYLEKILSFLRTFRELFVTIVSKTIDQLGKLLIPLEESTKPLMASILYFGLTFLIFYFIIRLISLCLFKDKYNMKRVKKGVDFVSFFIHLPLIVLNAALFMMVALVLTISLRHITYLEPGFLKDIFVTIEDFLKGGLNL